MDPVRIMIDPGHGGKDPGAMAHDIEEEDFNLIIASMVSMQLQAEGHKAKQTRADDSYVSLSGRAQMANERKADYFVSIHANAAESDKAEGMEAFYNSEHGIPLASSILGEMTAMFPDRKSRGVKQANFTVLTATAMPAVLIECGFITNPHSAAFLKNADRQVAMATAIARGILNHINRR